MQAKNPPYCHFSKGPYLIQKNPSFSNTASKVDWQHFTCLEIGVIGNAKKKMQLVDKIILLGEMFTFLEELLASYILECRSDLDLISIKYTCYVENCH